MQSTIWDLLRAFASPDAGRGCRHCREPIDPRDGFGVSERVCRPCRLEAEA